VRVAIGQFAATPEWQSNLASCVGYVDEAERGGADLLVLPEGVLARFAENADRIGQAAQPLDGPFVTALCARTAGRGVTVVAGIHEPAGDGLVYNTLVVLRDGAIVTTYRKLHLYDAFGLRESARVRAGSGEPPVFDCAGLRVGLMTCYDVRFPELARLLADRGAQLIALPAAWVRGPGKERHWEVMVAARALENTVYVAACGECSPRNIGASMLADPLGTVRARLGNAPGLLWANADAGELAAARRVLPVLANRRFAVNAAVLPAPADACTAGPGLVPMSPASSRPTGPAGS
jgi:deaminated glutathione amidase